MSSLPPVRRIITDHSPDGKAIWGSDEVLTPANPIDSTGAPPPEGSLIPSFTTIFRTPGYPADAQGPYTDPHGKLQNLVGNDGVVCRIVDFPPIPAQTTEDVNIMHRTVSLDYGVVLEGEIDLVLDDGLTKTMKKGDVVVQRGTIHYWRNASGAVCRVLFVLVPCKPIKVETTGEILPPSDMTHLSEEKEAKEALQKLQQKSASN